MNATCRHVEAPSSAVLSYDMPVNVSPSSGSWFHCLHATSHALQPIHRVVSVKNPLFTGFPLGVPGAMENESGCMSGFASTASVLTGFLPSSLPLSSHASPPASC